MIILASEELNLRKMVLEVLSEIENSFNIKLKICDVGGGTNRWLGNLVTHVVDLNVNQEEQQRGDKITFILGDICGEIVWQNIPDKYFDFISCTHTLEDIRDPGKVIQQLQRVAKSGFIAVPNRHQEMKSQESIYWNGYSHHRWIFTVIDESLVATAKFAIATIKYSTLSKFINHLIIFRNRFGGKYLRGAKFKRDIPNMGWHSSKLAQVRPENNLELSLIWEDKIPFEYWNNDYAGDGKEDLLKNLNTFLNSNFAKKLIQQVDPKLLNSYLVDAIMGH